MPAIPGLRSPYEKVGHLVYVGRMFDKIRLHARGGLPPAYQAALRKGLDGRTCNFLEIDYDDLQAKVLTGASDDEILAWCFARGRNRSEHDCVVWSAFMAKLGWRDQRSEFLAARVAEQGFAEQGVETFFDLIEIDEDRPLRSSHD